MLSSNSSYRKPPKNIQKLKLVISTTTWILGSQCRSTVYHILYIIYMLFNFKQWKDLKWWIPKLAILKRILPEAVVGETLTEIPKHAERKEFGKWKIRDKMRNQNYHEASMNHNNIFFLTKLEWIENRLIL